jgi:hypothetical protein
MMPPTPSTSSVAPIRAGATSWTLREECLRQKTPQWRSGLQVSHLWAGDERERPCGIVWKRDIHSKVA